VRIQSNWTKRISKIKRNY